MFETTQLLICNNVRNVIRNIRSSPFLYLFFFFMMVGSIVLFAVLTFFIVKTRVLVRIEEVFFTLFFIFFIKSAADMYTYFIKAHNVAYALSTPSKQGHIVGEIFLAILSTNFFIWISLSLLYLLVLRMLGINIMYPQEYVFFCIGIFLATMMGSMMVLQFYSPYRERLVLLGIVLLHYWISQNFLAISITTPGVLLYFLWTLRRSQDSYLFVPRKDRIKEQSQARIRSVVSSLCHRELTILWRERLLASFVLASISTGVFSGYLSIYGTDIFIPEELQKITGNILPLMFVFLGVYIMVIYTSVFPALNLFLTEEKTMWILRHLPLESKAIVYGKVLTMAVCYIASIPFLAYISLFIGIHHIILLCWLFSFSYIMGVAISVPLGVKFVGKKSDILLLYCVALLIFSIMLVAASAGYFLQKKPIASISFYILTVAIASVLLLFSLRFSSKILQQGNEIKRYQEPLRKKSLLLKG
ncbi:MAG: hypothetical protein QXX20_07825 [Candidatus Thermoplasmatota archaeon]